MTGLSHYEIYKSNVVLEVMTRDKKRPQYCDSTEVVND
jgi:hypothetical protein